jgi:hypothetical protein
MGVALLEKFYLGHTLWSGTLSSRQYKEHFFPAYPVFAYINANAPAQAKVLLAGEARNYYLKRPYRVSSAMDYCLLKKYLPRSRTSGEFVAAMRKDGFRYLVVNWAELQRLQEDYAILTASEKETLRYFLRPLEPLFRHGSTCLYRIGDS